jgi:hypothetical protein
MKMVEVLYFEGCPNVDVALERVRKAVAAVADGAEVHLVRVDGDAEAVRRQFLGSPIGAGPEMVTTTGRNRGTHFGGEVALDFMFWPWQRVGLWVEPAYDFIFQDGVSHGLGSTGGVMLGW